MVWEVRALEPFFHNAALCLTNLFTGHAGTMIDYIQAMLPPTFHISLPYGHRQLAKRSIA